MNFAAIKTPFDEGEPTFARVPMVPKLGKHVKDAKHFVRVSNEGPRDGVTAQDKLDDQVADAASDRASHVAAEKQARCAR